MVIVTNVTAAFWLFWHGRGEISGETTLKATPIVFLILNAVLLTSILAKNRRLQLTTPTRLVVTAVILALGASCCLWAALHKDLDFSHEILNEAVSSTPVSAIRPESRAILVQLLRTRLQNSREQTAAASRLKPITPALYSAESFENENVIQSVKSQVETAASFDLSYADKQQAAMNEFRARMSKVDPAYLESFEAERKEANEEFAKASSQEKQWLEATTALYDFAAANHGMMGLKGNQLFFSDSSVKASFEGKKERAIDLLNQLQASEKEEEKRQEKAMPDVPLSKLGLRNQ